MEQQQPNGEFSTKHNTTHRQKTDNTPYKRCLIVDRVAFVREIYAWVICFNIRRLDFVICCV